MKATLVLNHLLFISCLQQFSLAAPILQANENVVAVSSDVKRDVEYRNSLFSIYSCRVQKAADTIRNKLQAMTPNSETCHVGPVTPLPPTLQQRFDRLQAPQCTNYTYINTFLHKLLLFTNDADVRNIICHLNDAASSLNSIHFDLTGSSCPTFSYSEYLQIYDSMRVYHLPAPVSKYCILYSLDHDIRTLITNEERGINIDILPPCTLGLCSE